MQADVDKQIMILYACGVCLRPALKLLQHRTTKGRTRKEAENARPFAEAARTYLEKVNQDVLDGVVLRVRHVVEPLLRLHDPRLPLSSRLACAGPK